MLGKNYTSNQALHTNTILITMVIPQVMSNEEYELLVRNKFIRSCIPIRTQLCPSCTLILLEESIRGS